jgi:hypothetical protein
MTELLTNSGLVISPSIMTFKEYYMRFMGTDDTNLANGWGWFVDIELNVEPIRVIRNKYTNNTNNTNKYISPIKEYPSIRSMKSMKNLHDSYMIFENDENFKLDYRMNNYVIACTNFIGIIALTICYYITYH